MGMVSGTDLDLKTHSSKRQSSGRTRENMQATDAGARGGQLMTFNEEFEVKRELLVSNVLRVTYINREKAKLYKTRSDSDCSHIH